MIKNTLWLKCCHVSHEESLDQMARSLYEKLMKKINTLASWGYSEFTFEPGELSLFKYIHIDLHETVKTRLYKLFTEKSLAVKMDEEVWTVFWKPTPSESKVPRLTSRDLIQAGYNPAQGALFKEILEGLRGAILRNEVSNDTLQANLIWVKERFPIK
jgi:hypothetical protein